MSPLIVNMIMIITYMSLINVNGTQMFGVL